MRGHGRVDPGSLTPRTRAALLELKAALAGEPGAAHAQVTFDNIKAADVPPTVDFIWEQYPDISPTA